MIELNKANIQALKDLYLVHPTTKTREDIQYYVDCTTSVCDLCIERGVNVDKLYAFIEECLEAIQ